MSAHHVESSRALSPRRREDLLDRLVHVFLSQGFAALGVDDLALRCHVSTGTLLSLAPDEDRLRREVVEHWCARWSSAVERRVDAVTDPQRRPGEHLAAVAEQLAPAGNAFFRDLERSPTARQVYELATRRSADRVRGLLRDAVAAGRLRDVQASFVADTVAVVTARISSGDLLLSTGIDDARAYAELAELVTAAVAP